MAKGFLYGITWSFMGYIGLSRVILLILLLCACMGFYELLLGFNVLFAVPFPSIGIERFLVFSYELIEKKATNNSLHRIKKYILLEEEKTQLLCRTH